MNATSVFYRFLCFYKIIESFYIRRSKMAAQSKLRGEKPRTYTEDIPLSPDAVRGILAWIYPWRRSLEDEVVIDQILPTEALGKRFTTLREKVLEPMRNTIAHCLMHSGEIETLADRIEDIDKLLNGFRCFAYGCECFSPPNFQQSSE